MQSLLNIPVGDIRPNPQQPRQHFDETALQELADNIKINGLIQPVAVELHDEDPADTHYILIDGERRWRATKLAGLPTILAAVSLPSADGEQANERLIRATVANVQRANLTGIELARAFQQLSDQGLNDTDISRRVGLSRSRVNNLRRLLGLPEDILEDVANGRIQERQASDLLRLFALPKPLLDATAMQAKNIIERARMGDSSDSLRHQITNVIRWHTYSVDKSLFADHKFESGNFHATCCRGCHTTVRMDDGDWCADKGCYDRKRDSWESLRLTQAAQVQENLPIKPYGAFGRPFYPAEVARGREIVRDGCPHGALMLAYTPSSSSENDLLVEGFPDVRIVCARSGGCPCRETRKKPPDSKPLVEVFAEADESDDDENNPLCPECGEFLVGTECANCKRKKQPLAPYVSTAVAKPAPHLDLAIEAIASHLRKGNPKVWYALLKKIRPGYGYPADLPVERIQQHVAKYLTGNTVGDVEELGQRLADWGVSVKELPDEA